MRLINVYTNIDIFLDNKKDFYSPYSNKILNENLYNYIYNECYGEKFSNKIIINIWTKKEISTDEKNIMMDMIRRTFGLRVQDEIYYYEKAKDKRIVVFLVGIALIIMYYLAVIRILRELILILGWLAIWESTYSFITDNAKDLLRIRRLKELSKARIYFKIASLDEMRRYKVTKEVIKSKDEKSKK